MGQAVRGVGVTIFMEMKSFVPITKHRKILFSDVGKKCFLILFFFIALALYFFAPYRYSLYFVSLVFILYIIDFVFYFSLKRTKNYFTFDFIFSIVFAFVYFMYPLFIFPLNKSRFFMFNYGFNENVINKSTALAFIGYSVFTLGLLWKKEKSKNKREIQFKAVSMAVPNMAVASCVFLHLARRLTTSSVYSTGDANPAASDGVWGYISILQSAVIMAALSIEFYNQFHGLRKKNPVRNNPILFILLLADILITFSNGSRSGALQIILSILAGVSLLHNGFTLKKVFMLMLSGMALLSFIMVARSGGAFQFSFNVLNMTMDLIVNNYTLYIGYDYVQNNGYVPFTLIGSLLNAIPMFSGLVVNTFGISMYETSSARYFSLLVLGDNPSFGVGTNIIGALYLAGGLIFVIVFMFLLGCVISWLSADLRKSSLYKVVLYFTMIGLSVYIVRADYFYPVGKIVFEFFFALLFVSTFIWKKQNGV